MSQNFFYLLVFNKIITFIGDFLTQKICQRGFKNSSKISNFKIAENLKILKMSQLTTALQCHGPWSTAACFVSIQNLT